MAGLWVPNNSPVYKLNYLMISWNIFGLVIRQAEKDNVDNSNDYSYRLAGNITGSLGLKDVKYDFFLDTVVGPLTNKIVSSDPKNFAPPVDVQLREKFEA